MGYALAQAAADLGANVTLVSGPVNLAEPQNVKCIHVESAQQMLETVMEHVTDQDIFIGCAAVADYRIENIAKNKIKKSSSTMSLALIRNPDILATVAAMDVKPFTVGFAAETNDVETYARDKFERKNLDMIAANDVSNSEIGFNSNANALSVFWHQGNKELPTTDKYTLAKQLLTLITEIKKSK